MGCSRQDIVQVEAVFGVPLTVSLASGELVLDGEPDLLLLYPRQERVESLTCVRMRWKVVAQLAKSRRHSP